MIAILTTADTEILTLSHAIKSLPTTFPQVRAINPTAAESVDALIEQTIEQCNTAVVLRLLGGKRSFEAGFDRVRESCIRRGVPFIACAGDAVPDLELTAASTVPPEVVQQVFGYFVHGGTDNLRSLLLTLAGLPADPPRELPWFGVYHPQGSLPAAKPDQPTVAILFYRAHWMSHNLDFVDALVRALEQLQCNVFPVFVYSLKPENFGQVEPLLREAHIDAMVNTLSFAMGADSVELLRQFDVPLLQAIISTGSRAQWEQNPAGLSPIDTAMNVALPEFDGAIVTVPISFKEQVEEPGGLGARVPRYVADAERVDFLARLARNWAGLRRRTNIEKKIAFVLSNYPTKDARIGNAVGLDTPASVVELLKAMKTRGYQVGDLPENGDRLIQQIIDRCSNDRDSLTEEQLAGAVGHVPSTLYGEWFEAFPDSARQELRQAWDAPPGNVFRYRDSLAIPGIVLENVFVGVQPPRGFGDNPIAIYHSPELAPTHHYLAFYRWIRDVFQADAIVHVGKHGTLEWLPGKALGLSAGCFPELAIADLPHFYPFIINNPGEGTQAKRRAHAAIIDHLIPVMTTADGYNEIVRIEQLMDEYYQVQTLDPKKLPIIRAQIWQTIVQAQLHRDLGEDEAPDDFDRFLLHVDGYLCELKDSQIRDGLHTLGQAPRGEQLVDMLLSLTRLDNVEAPSLRTATASSLGLDYAALLEDRGRPYQGPTLDGVRSNGDAIEYIEARNRELVRELVDLDERAGPVQADATHATGWGIELESARNLPAGDERAGVRPAPTGTTAEVGATLTYIREALIPALEQTPLEIENLLRGLEGRFVPPGPSGAPTRGMANVLPTGRNFYSVDPKTLPSPAAWEVGRKLGDALLEKYLREEGRYPESVGIVVWGTSAMRTQGDDIGEILWLLGVRPVWMKENRRVVGLELIPPEELGRPRIDVTIRISGFFRDAFPNLVSLMDEAIHLAAGANEADEANLLAAHYRRDGQTEQSLYRIFGSKPGAYGAGILPLIDARNWKSDRDLAEVYTVWGGYAYTRQEYGTPARTQFEQRFAEIAIATKNQDNREHDIFDSDDYMQYHGGMIATVRALTGRNPRQFFGDSANPSLPRVRDLDDEARRVFRSRVVNPKWIESMKRHGYKGAFELAATVDYLFGYDATAQVVDNWMYERLTEAYVQDAEMRDFFERSNPWALRDIAERLMEAIDRGLWSAPSAEQQQALRQAYLEMDASLEGRSDR